MKIKQVLTLDLIDALQKNIEARPVWKPMHLQPFFESYDYFKENEDNSAYLFEHGVCLPSGSDMTDERKHMLLKLLKVYRMSDDE